MIDITDYEITRLSELLQPIKGSMVGKCVICAFPTRYGHKINFSDNFTSWNLLQEGDVICEYCYELIKNQDYRRNSWVLDKSGIKFLKRERIIDVLLNPPNPPFAIYITKTGKKQGFLQLINRINYSRERFCIAFDDMLIFVNRDELKRMVEIAEKAKNLKFSKSEMLGDIKVRNWEHEELCKKILALSKNPLWEVVVYAV